MRFEFKHITKFGTIRDVFQSISEKDVFQRKKPHHVDSVPKHVCHIAEVPSRLSLAQFFLIWTPGEVWVSVTADFTFK